MGLTADENETNLKFEHAKPFPFAPTLETGSRVRGGHNACVILLMQKIVSKINKAERWLFPFCDVFIDDGY